MDLIRGYQLGLFGEIDRQVELAKAGDTDTDRQVIAAVENLLPNTTGFGQSGWYRELESFLNEQARTNGIEAPTPFPDLNQTQTYLEQLISGEETFQTAVAGIAGSDFPFAITQAPYEYVLNYVTAGAAYPAFLLDKIRRIRSGPRTDPLAQPLRALEDIDSPRDVTRTSPRADSTTGDVEPLFITGAHMRSIFDHVDAMNVRSDWRVTLGPLIDEEFAKKSESCFGLLEESDGQYCGSIYTDYNEPDLSVEQVKKILDPRNWPICSTFFNKVLEQNPLYVDTGWSRLLEVISPEPEQYLMKTALIFYFGKFDGDNGVYLNYDVDVTKQNDSFIVEVDSGYIIVTKRIDGEAGVRIRTSKQERVKGLSPTATSALACHLGWGDLARDMLAGTARLVRDGKIPPSYLRKEFALSPPKADEFKGNSGKVDPTLPESLPAKLPGNFRDTIRDTRDLTNNLIDRITGTWGRAGQRWMDGMTRDDVKATTQEIGDHLNEFAQQVYTVAENDFKGQPRPRPEGD